MNINISVNQLHHSDIVADVRDALAESKLDPRSLTLEITETVMMNNTDLSEERLAELKELGVSIALDDFGTGYSSLGYLDRFPVDVIKMDRSFLSSGASPVNSGLATAVIGLGQDVRARRSSPRGSSSRSSGRRCARSAASSARASTSPSRWTRAAPSSTSSVTPTRSNFLGCCSSNGSHPSDAT